MRMYGFFLRDLYPGGRCEATAKHSGKKCRMLEVYQCKNGRLICKFHGGLSTGPKTPEGKAKAEKVRQEGWERHRERNIRAMRQGLKAWQARKRAEKREALERERARAERRLLFAEELLQRLRSLRLC